MPNLPLNGLKTHPLKPASLDILKRLLDGPIPYPALNPGVIDRLTRGNLAEVIEIPNPYRTKAKVVRALAVTQTGRRFLDRAMMGEINVLSQT